MQTEKRAIDCYDWLTLEDCTRFAALSFEVARRSATPPPGTRFAEDGAPWSTREDFANALATMFGAYVKTRAYQLGIAAEEFERESVLLAKWGAPCASTPELAPGAAAARRGSIAQRPWHIDGESAGCRGGTP